MAKSPTSFAYDIAMANAMACHKRRSATGKEYGAEIDWELESVHNLP